MAKRLIPSESYVVPVILAVLVHILIFGSFFLVWSTNKEIPVASKPLMIAQLYELQSQSPATTQTDAKVAGESDKTRAPVSLDDQMATRREEQEKAAAQKAAADKKAAEAKAVQEKKAAEAKAAQEKKKVAEQKLAEQKRIADKKALEEKKKLADEKAKKEAKANADAKAKADAKVKADAAAKAAKDKAAADARAAKDAKDKADAAARKGKEDKEAQALAELLGDKVERQATKGDILGDKVIGGLDDLLGQLIKANWTELGNPTKDTSVELLIEMLPDGTITKVSVSRSSGNATFDASALAAANNVGQVEEIKQLDRATFEQLYRKRKIVFKPKG